MKRKSKLPRTLLVLSLLMVFAACSRSGVPEGFDEAKVIGQAKQVITQLSGRKYSEVEAQFSPEMGTALGAGRLQAAVEPTLEKLGAFEEFQSEAAGSSENSAIGTYAVTVIKCRYEKGTVTYTISVDSAGKICGLFFK